MTTAVYAHDRFFIGGEWAAPSGHATLDVVSPHTERVIASVPDATNADMDAAVAAARRSFDSGDWSGASPADRLGVVSRLTELYGARLDELSGLITAQMGCPITFCRLAQAAASHSVLQAFLRIAADYPWEERRTGAFGDDLIVRREAVGVVAAIVPWNAPQLLIVTKLAPALLAGASIVIKPAPETPLDAYLLAEILEQAGLPKGVVSVLPGGREVGEHLVSHPDVDKVAFTGSTVAGRRIAAICGEQLKRCSLELGGKSAAIVLEDADLALTAQGLKLASLQNNGESCIAQTRILAPRSRYEDVVDAVAAMVSDLVVGDPFDPATDIGPMVAERQQQRVEKYIALGQEEGARTVVGGVGRPDGLPSGWYVRPTVFADVDNRMRIAREEIFGPVLAVIPYDNEADAIRIANDSDYGLGGSVWSNDMDHGLDVARQVRTGVIGVNQFTIDSFGPFGGYKSSGLGRESGPEGMNEYVELKTIVPTTLG